jgi:8-oxo-dGTP pyrophosphatase MutT (NUDIX family)
MSSKSPTHTQVSAGGVAFRFTKDQIEVALIAPAGEKQRWQLPKGLVGRDELPEAAALREVREEAGLETELVEPLDTIEYWYYSGGQGKRVRFHKFVHFYLLRYTAGSVEEHDQEVKEARWVEIGQAQAMLSFSSEKKVVKQAQEKLAANQRIDKST